ncbi:hypothetical protein K431DRAFT_101048 [Polychaeton citri CBS 116435]|uniref:Uncharacterized protein n=1 Tax=Polychaeton citri CBS 116435 TaxID=1314669 RepID=A0A9P4QI85_9PEZI|nr:hypothetical protein K431DRAFT_101048 [Polychaeton citri CBS 116435]
MQGVTRSHHVIIHTGVSPPALTLEEGPIRTSDGTIDSVRDRPIRVVADNPARRLDPMCRLNLCDYIYLWADDMYNVFGKVHRDSKVNLLYQFRDVQNRIRTATTTGQDPRRSTSSSTQQPVSRVQQQLPQSILVENVLRITDQINHMLARARSFGIALATPSREQIQYFTINRAAYEQYVQDTTMQIEAAIRDRS